AMSFSSLFNKRDFICFQVGDPIESFKVSNKKYKIKSFFEALFFLPLSFLPKKILFCSKDIYEFYKKNFSYLIKNLDYLPLTIDTKLFVPKDKKTARKKLGLPINKEIILYVGRIEYMKGSDISLELIKNNPNKIFVLIGEINDNHFKNLNLQNLIHLNSKKHEELVDYYNSADLCIFPSRIESFGFVPREAMSCGLPTLVSDIKSLRTLESAIKSKLNYESMNNEIKKFFEISEKQKKKISLESRKFIIKEYSEENLKKEFINKLFN
ncbi:MAG: glycosyltransferase family 4 protein, partial [Nanoarchaeota archaeon]|nr:glycosyltransferase family 4 protein [Nanoarchaeota archaeon]